MSKIAYQCKRGKRVLEEGFFDSWEEFHKYREKNFPNRCKHLSGRLVL